LITTEAQLLFLAFKTRSLRLPDPEYLRNMLLLEDSGSSPDDGR